MIKKGIKYIKKNPLVGISIIILVLLICRKNQENFWVIGKIKKLGKPFKKVGKPFKKVGEPFKKVGGVFKKVGEPFKKVGGVFKNIGGGIGKVFKGIFNPSGGSSFLFYIGIAILILFIIMMIR